MLFSAPIAPLPKITAPTAAEICEQSKPSAQGKALLTPGMTPPQYQHALEKNKLPVDSVHFLAHGLPPKDGLCWACQSCRLTAPKLCLPELNALQLTEAWLKNPTASLLASLGLAMGQVDFTGPGGWCAQAALWINGPKIPGVNLVAAAVAGAILIAAGLLIGPAMPSIPKPRLQLPMLPPTPELLLLLKQPALPLPQLPALDQLKLMKMLLPFIDLGKGVAIGSIRCS